MSKLQNKKVLYLLSGNEPSAFVRAGVFNKEFKKNNIDVNFFQLRSFFLMQLKKKIKSLFFFKLLVEIIIGLYYNFRGFYLLNKVAKYDVIIAIKFIKSSLLTKIKNKSKALFIYDFDDSVWLDIFDGEEEFSKKVSIVDCITSDNSFLASYASKYNKNSFVVNGPNQVEKFIQYKNTADDVLNHENKIILGWLGSPSTMFYLYKIYDTLELIGEKYPNVILKIVGTGIDLHLIPQFEKIKVEAVPFYDQNEMIRQVYTFDIGLYPLFFNELSLGRGSLKATIYMAGSVPVVCSAFGENSRIINNGVNGFLANDTSEWVEKLSLLIDNPLLRNKIGENGFVFAKNNYSIESCFNQLFYILDKYT